MTGHWWVNPEELDDAQRTAVALPFDERRSENCAILNTLVTAQHLHNIYDVILLDETQDYLPDEAELLLRLGKNIFAAGDDRQRIYDHPSPISNLCKRCNTHHLPHH